MVQIERNDAILVKFMTLKEDGDTEQVCSYYTTAIDETIKMFVTVKENELKCWFNEYSMCVPEKYLEMEHYVADVIINLGSTEDVPSIEVILT